MIKISDFKDILARYVLFKQYVVSDMIVDDLKKCNQSCIFLAILNFSAKLTCGKLIPYSIIVHEVSLFTTFVCLLLFICFWATQQHYFFVKMNEQKIEIPQEILFECYICQLKFDQYALEVHFVTVHSNVQNNDIKISKGFEQKLASFGLKTLFKVQMGSQKLSKERKANCNRR